MRIFFTDLDNTLIYSYKHDLQGKKRCVEIYRGREISFVTEKTWQLFKELKEREDVLVVPTTTRTVEQYERIDFGVGGFSYALTCNGGVLLENGKENEQWYQESLNLVADCQMELENAANFLKNDPHICFEIRNIRDLFLFTKSDAPEESMDNLKQNLDLTKVDVFSNGVKVYVVPKKLTKGEALLRFTDMYRKKFDDRKVQTISAGDSAFDLPMLKAADVAIAPWELKSTLDEYVKISGDEKQNLLINYMEKEDCFPNVF